MDLLIIELKRKEVTFATFARKRGQLTFIDAARHPLGAEDSLPLLITECAARTGAERTVVLAIPSQQLFFREMALPITDRRKVRELLPLELKGETAVDAEQLVFDALPLAEGKMLAIWAKRHWLQDLIGLLAEKGLEPEIVTASLFNWQSLIAEEAANGAVALTDGDSVAVYVDRKPLFFRILGDGDQHGELARTMAALEIAKGVTIERIFAHSGHCRKLGLDDPAAATTLSPLAISGAFAETFGGDAETAFDLAGSYAVARAVTSGEFINLRSGDLSYTAGAAKMHKKLRLSLFLAVTLIMLLFVEAGMRWYWVRQDLKSLDGSITSIYRQVFPTRKKAVDEVSELRSEIKRLNSGRTSSNTLLVLKNLAEAKGDDILGIFEAEIDGTMVRIKGDARSFQSVTDFKSRAGVVLSDVEVSDTKSKPDGSVTFVLRGMVKEARL